MAEMQEFVEYAHITLKNTGEIKAVLKSEASMGGKLKKDETPLAGALRAIGKEIFSGPIPGELRELEEHLKANSLGTKRLEQESLTFENFQNVYIKPGFEWKLQEEHVKLFLDGFQHITEMDTETQAKAVAQFKAQAVERKTVFLDKDMENIYYKFNEKKKKYMLWKWIPTSEDYTREFAKSYRNVDIPLERDDNIVVDGSDYHKMNDEDKASLQKYVEDETDLEKLIKDEQNGGIEMWFPTNEEEEEEEELKPIRLVNVATVKIIVSSDFLKACDYEFSTLDQLQAVAAARKAAKAAAAEAGGAVPEGADVTSRRRLMQRLCQ